MVRMTLFRLAATWTATRAAVHAMAFTKSPRFANNLSSMRRTSPETFRWNGYGPMRMSSSATTEEAPSKVPITLLSGFLGSGKTTTLQHLLENTEGAKIGVIVNDVASVNIDAKLVSGKKNGVVELQNGCVCCSLADELLTSVEAVLGEDRQFDAVVVELSGVADPIAIKSNWNAAKMKNHPVTERADMSQIVTLVDATTFGTDWMTWDVAGERDGWVEPGDDCSAQRKVPELLAEQIEAATVLIVNKADLAGPDQLEIATKLAREMNDKAIVEQVEFGKISPKQILKTFDAPEEEEEVAAKSEDVDTTAHSHSHEHSDCTDPGCTDSSHEHSHEHSSHNEADCTDPGCTDSSHEHSHEHSSCNDPDCTDTSHSHSHSHATSTDELGITNFVYKANRPFNMRKIMPLLNKWPVPMKDDLDLGLLVEAQKEGYEVKGKYDEGSPFIGVLRSKGFCWFAPTRWSGPNADAWRHDTAMYWSHAGKQFGITSAGKWWGTITREQMKKYFVDDMDEYNRIIAEDFVSDEYSDRRQEIVFIGVGLDEEKITRSLDECLLSEKGMQRYKQELTNFMNTAMATPAAGGGLFSVGGIDHMDVNNPN